jgi:hypothetical protein
MADHEHLWVYQGTVHWKASRPLSGSDAHERIYGDRYFCQKCLEYKIINERILGNNYSPPIAGTLPR